MQRRSLPFGSEFSPKQIDLARLLELAYQHRGNRNALQDAIRKAYFDQRQISDQNKHTLAMNTRISMQQYGIIDENIQLTTLGEQLYNLRQNHKLMYDTLAKHILIHLNGLAFVQCILGMQAAGEKITLESLRKRLPEYGIDFPSAGRHASTLKLWLKQAGVFIDDYRVDQARLQELLGMSASDIEVLASLTPEQRAFIKAFCNAYNGEPLLSNKVARLASETYGLTLSEKNLPKSVLYPLQNEGFITLQTSARSQGRGAKPFYVAPTDKLRCQVLEPLLKQLEGQLPQRVLRALRKPLSDIINEVKNASTTSQRGTALEALALRLMRIIDLTYEATRLRNPETGFAEVDLLFYSTRLVYSRWQVQCKNTNKVRVDDIAKEVGLHEVLKTNVIVIVTTGKITKDAQEYASRIMDRSNLAIVCIDGKDLQRIARDPTSIVDVFRREAEYAMRIKTSSLEGAA